MSVIKTRHYNIFSGVDLSSDPTLVDPTRSPYMVNMYKDYLNGQGNAIETIPGFRERISLPQVFFENQTINGIHQFFDNGVDKYLIHANENLYVVNDINQDYGIIENTVLEVTENTCVLPFEVYKVERCSYNDCTIESELGADKKTITIEDDYQVDKVAVDFIRYKSPEKIKDNLQNAKSKSVYFNNSVYIMDGSTIYVYKDGEVSEIEPYVPTTYIGISASDMGEQFEFRNILTPYFKNTFVGDGETKTFYFSEKDIDEVEYISVYGDHIMFENTLNVVSLNHGCITFNVAPSKPTDEGYDEGYAGIEIKMKKDLDIGFDTIMQMQEFCLFDGRLFVGGNPNVPSHICYSAFSDFSFFPNVNYQIIGANEGIIKKFLPYGEELFVFKNDTFSGSIYKLIPSFTEFENNPKIYTAKALSSSIGAMGDVINFLDSPIFVSRLGLKAIGYESLTMSRTIENRSSLIDSNILNKDLANAKLIEFNGYLLMLIDGTLYMGDSRGIYKNSKGENEFEWFVIEDVGSYENSFERFVFSSFVPNELESEVELAPEHLWGKQVSATEYDGENRIVNKYIKVLDNGKPLPYYKAMYKENVGASIEDGEIVFNTEQKFYLAEAKNGLIGGNFHKATDIFVVGNNLYFASNGKIFSFNFDKFENGALDSKFYDFDKRVINAGVATCLDNVGFPNQTKSTIKKSLVIKCKTKKNSNAKIRVRTDKKGFSLVKKLNNSHFDFVDLDFSDISFNTSDQQIFMANEKEKRWVEKQVYVYTDEIHKPFAMYYLSYQFKVVGKIKNK